ncbi:MAG: hypothetical protein LBI74_08160 [Synergistaceae bacterium]|jgi:hypothetical protein|nr:hypothetical protein [Synergistaceae bacterium]
MFKRGKHAYSPKYARFMKRYEGGARKKRVKRSSHLILDERGEAIEVSPGVFLPSRREIRSREKRGGRLFATLRFIVSFRALRVLIEGIYVVRKRMKSVKKAQKAALLGYIPLGIFIGVSLVSLGLYPYIWAWGNVYAFTKVCGERIGEGALRRFAATGFCVQLLVPVAAGAFMWGAVADSPWAYDFALKTSAFFAITYMFFVGPIRCSCFFDLRWNLRSAVASWDRNSMMIDRTMTSWAKLFFLGSTYIQYHINRLMGLGMPGFADPEEIAADFSLLEWARDYVRARSKDIHEEDDYYDEPDESGLDDDAAEDGADG